ncbi:hypothetical protein M413DRAFT_449280 [Hebeloma cylindrosporum]|uniref:Uncharacterized protein n=1 Tax=Hebeloma cylindrosporum TaxID=76867 RepID=A0A0C3BVY5_HEBCY|nr:hypothetical protein M413DRAFT_449280 [Hebeloma cylindrosporum h7]
MGRSPPGCNRCIPKVLRPDRCVTLDGQPCLACVEDMGLEKKLKKLEILVDEIHAKRRALRTVMNENHDRLIHRFPPEIASTIFFQYSLEKLRFEYTRDNPILLGAVCQKWRQLAWATPELWTSIYIGPDMEKMNWSSHTERIFSEWLERSRTLPLSIRLFDRSYGDRHLKVFDAVTNMLNLHSARWQDIHFELPEHHFHRLCGSSQGNINIMRRLVLVARSTSSARSAFSMKCKPSPIVLKLKALGPEYVDISWNALTVISLDSLTVDEFVDLLRRSPNLVTITLLDMKPLSGPLRVPNTRISCPHVRSLEMLYIEEGVIGKLLNSICFPSLKRWTLKGCVFSLESMILFIESSSFCLKTLKVDEFSNPNQTHELFRHLPSIELLHWFFHGRPPAQAFYDLLCSPGDIPFLPSLQTLKMGCDYGFPLDSIPPISAAPHRRSLKILRVDSMGWVRPMEW